MIRLTVVVAIAGLAAGSAAAQDSSVHDELRAVMAEFVAGWRDGDSARLARVVAVEEGRVTWVGGSGADERVQSMTFAALMARNRANPDYGLDGWDIESMDVVNDELAFVRLRVFESDKVNVDYMVCYRVSGVWRIVSNTFVIMDR